MSVCEIAVPLVLRESLPFDCCRSRRGVLLDQPLHQLWHPAGKANRPPRGIAEFA